MPAHGKTIWRPPLKDKDGRVTASGYGMMHNYMHQKCGKDCKQDKNFDCNLCKRQKVIDYILKLHLRRHAEGTAMNCVCDFATCDIMSVGKCKQLLSKDELQAWVDKQGTAHKVDEV